MNRLLSWLHFICSLLWKMIFKFSPLLSKNFTLSRSICNRQLPYLIKWRTVLSFVEHINIFISQLCKQIISKCILRCSWYKKVNFIDGKVLQSFLDCKNLFLMFLSQMQNHSGKEKYVLWYTDKILQVLKKNVYQYQYSK